MPMPIKATINKIRLDGSFIVSRIEYTRANHIPSTNSQRYCKQKLFQILKSCLPRSATTVAQSKLINREHKSKAICPPYANGTCQVLLPVLGKVDTSALSLTQTTSVLHKRSSNPRRTYCKRKCC